MPFPGSPYGDKAFLCAENALAFRGEPNRYRASRQRGGVANEFLWLLLFMKELPYFERNLRRLRVYVPRAVRMFSGRQAHALCCFMHIPKSGGTSLSEALHASVPLNQHIGVIAAIPTRRVAGVVFAGVDDPTVVHEDGARCEELFKLRELQLMVFMAEQNALIHGHFLFSQLAYEKFGGSYRYVSVLRDPIQRVVSNYRAARFENYFMGSFEEYLASDVGRRHAQVNLRYFSGMAEIPRGKETEALSIAKDNQDKFSLIGVIEDMNLFRSQYNDLFRTNLKIRHYNVARGDKVRLSSSEKASLERLCAEDLVLYERARRQYSRAA